MIGIARSSWGLLARHRPAIGKAWQLRAYLRDAVGDAEKALARREFGIAPRAFEVLARALFERDRFAHPRALRAALVQRQRKLHADDRIARVVADALFGYARYTEAAEMYRLALSKGGEDANLVNTRLGATLALAGQRAEAEAALRAVTGPRAELAALWLAWLASRPA